MLKSKIQQDLIVSLKARDQERVDALRLLLAEVQNKEIDIKRELPDEDVAKLLRSITKKLREALEMFKKGGRVDLEKQNQAHIDIYAAYLPAELSDEALMQRVGALMVAHKQLFEKNPKMVIPTIMKELSSEADAQKIITVIKKHQP